jgi:hypothetical protein
MVTKGAIIFDRVREIDGWEAKLKKNPQLFKGIIRNLKNICIREIKIFDEKGNDITKQAVIQGESDSGGFLNLDRITDNNTKEACVSKSPVIDKPQQGWISLSFPEKQNVKKIEIYHGMKNDCAIVSIAKDFVLQYNNGSGWSNIPGMAIKDNDKEVTDHEFPAVSTTGIKILINDQTDLYDFSKYPFSIENP